MPLYDVLIIGQGLAGTTLAWQLIERGASVAVLDREEAVTASRVAAGLLTPITGQRLARAWRLDDLWPVAREFYPHIEAKTGERFFQIKPAVRILRDDEQERFATRQSSFEGWVELPEPPLDSRVFAAPHGSFAMPAAAHLDVPAYLDASRRWFSREQTYVQADLDPVADLDLTGDWAEVPRLGLTARKVVFCQGLTITPNPWFPPVRFEGVKGEILTLRIPRLHEERVVHRGIWLLPMGDGLFRCGATYDRESLDSQPTVAGRETLLNELAEFLRLPLEVVDHQAAVRPVIDAGKPLLGFRPTDDRVAIFNGLGSKGALLAPYFASQLAWALLTRGMIDPEVTFRTAADPAPPPRLVDLAQARVKAVLKPGEIAIDATAGNGLDTLVLAQQVGASGQVYAFDVQRDALQRTGERLQAAGLANVTLLARDHAEMALALPANVTGRVAAIMFNLGYLPGGDKQILTHSGSSVAALRSALTLLRPGGIITVIAYTGHAGGPEETAAISSLLDELPADRFAVERVELNRPTAPQLFVIHRSVPANVRNLQHVR